MNELAAVNVAFVAAYAVMAAALAAAMAAAAADFADFVLLYSFSFFFLQMC